MQRHRRVHGALAVETQSNGTYRVGWEEGVARSAPRPELCVRPTIDFEPTGDGAHAAWLRTPWVAMSRVGTGVSIYPTLFKCLYSPNALYLLVDCGDARLTTRAFGEGGDVWRGDAVEVFLWPNELVPVYFQYDLSPLGAELALLVPNDGHSHTGWAPWYYEGPRRVRAKTVVRGGPREPMAYVVGWTAEIRIPFALLAGLMGPPPAPGVRWRGNVYRVDHDGPRPSHWAWCDRTGADTHAFREYGSLVFAEP